MNSHQPCAAAPEDLADELGLELGRHARLLHLFKTQIAAHGPAGLDAAAFGLLLTLLRLGPLRQGELAEAALLDPSTVSRHVAQLVKSGLVERQADAADGRAVRLVASRTGTQIGEDLVQRRREMVRDVLRDWPDDDVATMVRLLRRFNDDLEHLKKGNPPGHPAHHQPNQQES